MATYQAKSTGTNGAIGHAYLPDTPFVEYTTRSATRFYTSFDMTAYTSGNMNLSGPTADGFITKTVVIPPDAWPDES